MKKKIKEIAIVRSGAYIQEAPEGDICYLQVNHFDRIENRFLLSKPTLEWNCKTENHLLSEGDLVFAAKGTSNFCAVFHSSMGKVVASSSFMVISITDQTVVNPDFLCWVLNREDTLAFFKAHAGRTSMPSISKKFIEDYEINIPPVHIQQKIVAIDQLQQRERLLHDRILSLRNMLIQNQLIKTTKYDEFYGE